MKRVAVIYQSKYGTTKKYAKWIVDEFDGDLYNRKDIKPTDLDNYDIIIYGGGLYAGGILGIDIVNKILPKNLIVFMELKLIILTKKQLSLLLAVSKIFCYKELCLNMIS